MTLMRPLLGLSNMTQEMEMRIGGRMFGTIAVSSNSRRKGALVRMVIQAKAEARTTERPAEPMPKINELRTRG